MEIFYIKHNFGLEQQCFFSAPNLFYNLGPTYRDFTIFLSSLGHFSKKNKQEFQELLTYSKIILKMFCLSIVSLIAFNKNSYTIKLKNKSLQ